jgi:hypothetical protein
MVHRRFSEEEEMLVRSQPGALMRAKAMNNREFQQLAQGKFHHHALFTLNDGSTREGYMQPPDEQNVYLTALDGTSAGSVAIADIKSIRFPDDE